MTGIITKNNVKRFKIALLFCFTVLLLTSCISSYIGYNGYKKWSFRRNTHGDKSESINRGAFVKDLHYKSSMVLDHFHIYIEKGYWYGYHRIEDETRFVKGTHYPYQVSCTWVEGQVYSSLVGYREFDSIINEPYSSPYIYLDQPHLKDTLVLKIMVFHKDGDSIGYIKVWDTDTE
jgi:hypothetical protein